MFKKSYIMYILTTKSKGYSVERRYSDFLNMRQELIKRFPGYIIPPIPVKKLSKNLDPEFVHERRSSLQLFLKDILKHPLSRNSDIFEKFISATSKDWEEIAKLFKVNVQKEIDQYETIEGKAKVDFDNHTIVYCDKIFTASKSLKEAYKDISAINQEICENMKKLSACFNKVSGQYQKLSSLYLSLEDKAYSELFFNISEGSSHIGEQYELYKNEYETKLSDYFTYYCLEISAIEELVQIQRTFGERMETGEKKLRKKKEQRFDQKNIATWELEPSAASQASTLLQNKEIAYKEMLPKETKEVQKFRILYGYHSNKLVEEFKRILEKNRISLKSDFIDSISVFTERTASMKKVFVDLFDKIKMVELDINLSKNASIAN